MEAEAAEYGVDEAAAMSAAEMASLGLPTTFGRGRQVRSLATGESCFLLAQRSHSWAQDAWARRGLNRFFFSGVLPLHAPCVPSALPFCLTGSGGRGRRQGRPRRQG